MGTRISQGLKPRDILGVFFGTTKSRALTLRASPDAECKAGYEGWIDWGPNLKFKGYPGLKAKGVCESFQRPEGRCSLRIIVLSLPRQGEDEHPAF